MYIFLEGLLKQEKVTRQMIADKLDLKISTVSGKLNDSSKLKFCEAKKIRDSFFPDYSLDYLFRVDDTPINFTNKKVI